MFFHLLNPNAKRKEDMYLIQVGSRMIADLLFLPLLFLPRQHNFCYLSRLTRRK